MQRYELNFDIRLRKFEFLCIFVERAALRRRCFDADADVVISVLQRRNTRYGNVDETPTGFIHIQSVYTKSIKKNCTPCIFKLVIQEENNS